MFVRDDFEHCGGIERRRIQPIPPGALRLHRLERPIPWPQDLREKMAAFEPTNFYPDYAPFYKKLHDFTGWNGRIVVGQGIEGLIRDLVMLCCRPGDGLAFTWPTCAMFDLYGHMFGANITRIVTDPDHDLSAQALAEQLPEGLKLLLLPNPGQPVDVFYRTDELDVIAQKCYVLGAVLAIDEAYWGFGAESGLGILKWPNVVVLRTFSKAFGAAALRVGYAMGHGKIMDALEGVRQSGEISGPSLHGASVLLDHYESHVWPGINEIRRGRNWSRNRLEGQGFKVRGSNANHVLIDLSNAEAIGETLRNRGVFVRYGMPAPVHRHLLVTCGDEAVMREFSAAFDIVVSRASK